MIERYIGLDAHSQSCTAVVMGPTGRRLRQQVLETDAKVLRDFLRGIAGRKHLCLEEGSLSEWLYELLEPLVYELVVVQPEKRGGNKSDTIDAWSLADDLRRDAVQRRVYKATGRLRGLRQAVRTHQGVRADLTRVKNQLGALCRARGLHDATQELYEPRTRATAIAALPEHYRRRAALLCAELDGRSASCQAAEQWLREEATQVPIIERLTTAPGIGQLRAAQIVATVVTPHRFRTKRQFWSYCGLAIVTRSSSDYVKDHRGRWVYNQQVVLTRGLNRNRHPLLKNVFKGAALTVATQMPDHPLHHSYQRALNSTKPNLARLTLARRIAAAVLAMWKHDQDYDPAKHQRA